MIELTGQPAELRFTLEITRKETGKVEVYEMVGHADPEELKKILGAENGRDPLDSST